MSQEELFINGELLRLRREARGWVLNDMATRACMSVKQIRQLEEGGMSSFYSVAVKVTAAKKVGALLGLSAEEVFAQNVEPVVVEELVEREVPINEVVAESVAASEAEDAPVAHVQVKLKPEHIESVVVESSGTSDPKDETPNSNNSLLLIAGLLGVALAVGAYFQPQEEPAAEPAPPIQVLPPADAVDPASAASAADSPASVAEVVAAPASVASVPAHVLQKPASTPALNSTAVVPAASAARVVVPAASGTSVMRAASSPVAAVPSAAAASKTP